MTTPVAARQAADTGQGVTDNLDGIDPDRVCGNLATTRDRLIGAPPAHLDALLAALDVPAVSIVSPAPGDLVVEQDTGTEQGVARGTAPGALRVVVRKPREPLADSTPFLIGELPADPVDAYRQLRKRLKQAADEEASVILFPRDAVIQLSNPKPEAAHLVIKELRDTLIDFNGATLELLGLAPGIVIKESQRLILRNGTLKGTHLLASVGLAERDTDSPIGLHLRVLPEFVTALEAQFAQHDAGPPLTTIGLAHRVDERWKPRARGNIDIFTNRGTKNDRFVYRRATQGTSQGTATTTAQEAGTVETGAVTTATAGSEARFEARSDSPRASALAPGQPLLLLHLNNAANGIVLDNKDADLEDISLENMTLMNIPGMGVFGEVNRGLHLDGVHIVPDPDNPLSLLGSSSDAVHINNNGGDIVVENSHLGPSADDLLTIKGNWWRVAEIDREAGTANLVNADRRYGVHLWARAGDRLVATNAALELLGSTRHVARSTRQGSKRHTVHLGEIPAWLQPGQLVANPDLGGGRTVIRNNRFDGTRAQGILVQSRHVIVENNHFTDTAGPAIELNFALTDWHEGVTAGNVLVRDNVFENTATGATKPPYSVYFHERDGDGTPIQLIGDVRLVGNRHTDSRAAIDCP